MNVFIPTIPVIRNAFRTSRSLPKQWSRWTRERNGKSKSVNQWLAGFWIENCGFLFPRPPPFFLHPPSFFQSSPCFFLRSARASRVFFYFFYSRPHLLS